MLKSLVAAITFATLVSPTTQAVEFINQDGSKYSQVCIAAAQSSEALERELDAQGISNFQANEINEYAKSSYRRTL